MDWEIFVWIAIVVILAAFFIDMVQNYRSLVESIIDDRRD